MKFRLTFPTLFPWSGFGEKPKLNAEEFDDPLAGLHGCPLIDTPWLLSVEGTLAVT